MPEFKTVYFQREDIFRAGNEPNPIFHSALPVGTYIVKVDEGGFYYQLTEPFKRLDKYYGELPKYNDRIIATYHDRLKSGLSTGVLLSGEKGSGKTLLAKKIALDLGLPIIIVNRPFSNDDFKQAISKLGRVVVFFDEFEKTYSDEDSQNALLTLLDGVYNPQALFFVIVNDKWKLTDALDNRPGRLYYHLEYTGLSTKFVTDYCEDKLDNKAHIQSILTVTSFFVKFNFDQLKALVEEMNRYKEDASEAVKMLNIKAPIFTSPAGYEVEAFWGPDLISLPVQARYKKLQEHPFTEENINVYVNYPTGDGVEEINKYLKSHGTGFTLTRDNITNIDQKNGKFEYRVGEVIFIWKECPRKEWQSHGGIMTSSAGLDSSDD